MNQSVDIAPELWKKLLTNFRTRYNSNSQIKSLIRKANEGTATYVEAEEYSQLVGSLIRESLDASIGSADLPNGHMYYNIAEKTILPILQKGYDLSVKMCAKVQTQLNTNAGMGIKAQIPEFESDQANGILNVATSRDQYDDVKDKVGSASETITAKVADRSVQKNADFHYRSGMKPKIVRVSVGDCCQWCKDVAGTYDYEDVKNTGNKVFRRHANCRCLVTYDPGDGNRQDVWSKTWYSEKNYVEVENTRKSEEEEKNRNLQKELSEHIKNGEISLELNPEKQADHMKDTHLEGSSYFTISLTELQNIVYTRSGTGKIYTSTDKKTGLVRYDSVKSL